MTGETDLNTAFLQLSEYGTVCSDVVLCPSIATFKCQLTDITLTQQSA